MDISRRIAELKLRPDFTEHVGMVLVHNGTVRAWSRKDRRKVTAIEVEVDHKLLADIREEFLQHEGIYDIIVEARTGTLRPGDDLLFIIVAGDLRENVKPVLAGLLDRIKLEAVSKRELTDDL